MHTTKTPTARLLTAEDVGHYLNVSTDVARQMIASGQLQGIKVGNRWLAGINSVNSLLREANAPEIDVDSTASTD